MTPEPPIDFAALRARLARGQGPSLWRSLEELSGTDGFRESAWREFPHAASEWDDGVSRRNFLKLMGASLALAGVYGCSQKPEEKILPYVNPPEQVVAGKPMYFASAMPFCGFAKGVLVESREGRPIKIEGNPDHPASLGGTDVFMQASILTLYDPERSQVITRAGGVSSWTTFYDELRSRLQSKRAGGGAGLRVLTGTVTSPTLAAQLRQFLNEWPQARWHQFDPAARSNTAAGLQQALGSPSSAVYHMEKARVVVALDSDFLFEDPGSLRYARQFINGRRVRRAQMEMNRLYVAESTMSMTGSMADHRLPLRPSRIEALAVALSDACLSPGSVRGGELPPAAQRWLQAAAADLRNNAGSCVVIAGEAQPPAVHVIAHALNQALGNVGNTVIYTDAVLADPVDPNESLRSLTADMSAGAVDMLVILGENPAYNAPADVDFARQLEALSKTPGRNGGYANFTARLGLYEDETSFLCQWHLPEAHYLESWGDLRAFDGTTSIVQPLIAPLYGGRSTSELVEAVLGRPDRGGYEIVRSYWQSQVPAGNFETWWEAALTQGAIEGTALPPRQAPHAAAPPASRELPASEPAGGLEIVFRPDPCVWDGSFANNAWLQELPKPFTKLTWDNAALISPRTAQRLGLTDGDVATLRYGGRALDVPVMILPGEPDDVVTAQLGYGRTRAGRVGTDSPGEWDSRGFSAYLLRTSDAPWFGVGAELAKTGRRHRLVVTQNHHAMASLPGMPKPIRETELEPDVVATPDETSDEHELHNRRLVRVGTLEQFRAKPDFVREIGGEVEKKPLLSLYPGWDYSKGYQWGMSIDMQSCIGCNACIIACQSENNIPVVGKEEVSRQREMHWIRVDDYFAGDLDDPHVYHQPVTCMHCENAPCEVVCPVGATTHSVEGLNEMTYNRCIGTRYCSNNCPYKVRRFNFFDYASDETAPSRKLQHNPDVTVRARGVMEKCTYCVQRITRTRIDIEKMIVQLEERARRETNEEERKRLAAEVRRRELEMLEQLQTACQQACPTEAIVFGNINRPETKVARLKAEPLDYGLLVELNTRPRTTYLARVVNPSPALNPGGHA